MAVWTDILDAVLLAGKPIKQSLLTAFRDNAIYLKDLLASHNHDGSNSALIEAGSNLLRNGSFESGETNWTLQAYAGGAVSVQESGAMHGDWCIAMTSSVLANGGGDAVSSEYIPVSGGLPYSVMAKVLASASGISGKIVVIWYDAAQSQISEADAFTSTSAPTTEKFVGSAVVSPALARYARIKIVGGVPASGSAVGTIYFDGVFVSPVSRITEVGTKFVFVDAASMPAYGSNSTATPTKVREFRIPRAGWYTVRMNNYSSTPAWAYSRIYRNGVAYGTSRTSINNSGGVGSWDEDLWFDENDLCQIYVWTGSATFAAYATGIIGEATPQVIVKTM